MGPWRAFQLHRGIIAMNALLIDLDGVLYQGEEAIPGAAETLGWMSNRAIS